MKNFSRTICCLVLSAAFLHCGHTIPPGSPETGWSIWGFVGQSAQQAAPGETVTVLNENGATVAATSTDLFGKFVVSGLQPGAYTVRVGKIDWFIALGQENQRIDIDLSAPGGKMDYAAAAMKEAEQTKKATKTKKTGGNAAGDPQLVQQFAGKYWGYSSGSTATSSGGTERKWAFCPDGTYYASSETGYTFDHYDESGNHEGSTPTLGGSQGDGSWSIEGTVDSGTITIEYHNSETGQIQYERQDEQCYKFDGTILCKTGPCE